MNSLLKDRRSEYNCGYFVYVEGTNCFNGRLIGTLTQSKDGTLAAHANLEGRAVEGTVVVRDKDVLISFPNIDLEAILPVREGKKPFSLVYDAAHTKAQFYLPRKI